MNMSLPSAKVAVLDAPEPQSFSAVFVYNFFTPDEMQDSSENVVQPIVDSSLAIAESTIVHNLSRNVPRYIKFDLSTIKPSIALKNEFMQYKPDYFLSLKDNFEKIQSEESFSNSFYSGFEFQDTNVDKKLYTLVSGSIAKRIVSKNRAINKRIDDDRATIIGKLNDEYSLLDAAKALANDTSNNVSNNVIVNALNDLNSSKLMLVDETTQRELIDSSFSAVRDVSIRSQLSNKLVGTMIKNIVNDPMNQFSDEFANLQKSASALQSAAVTQLNSNTVKHAEFDATFNAILRKASSPEAGVESFAAIAGYIIEKNEILSSGNLRKHDPIIIQNPDATFAIDLNVTYGRTYVYAVKTVLQVQVRAHTSTADDAILATGLVESRRSRRVVVNCSERVPPPAITDLNIIWNFELKSPMLLWSFPVNKQRDIKQFQIFRRKSVTDAFELIKVLDFDDSIIKSQKIETPDPSLIDYLGAPLTSFTDTEFGRDSSCIYTVCSVDAHGYSSNYSIQFEVSFDAFKNKIKKKLISDANAPKSYPNMMIKRDLFIDLMKVSGHTRLQLYFDPEYIELLDAKGNDLRLLATDIQGPETGYRLQIMNTDIQKSESILISINDRTTTHHTSPERKA